MRTLITGGSGYIGSRLANALARRDCDVRVFDIRDPESRPAGFVRGSTTDHNRIVETLQGIDLVYHLAWSFHCEDFLVDVKNNLLGTLNLLEGCRACGVKQFIFASSAVVYGPTASEQADEEQVCHPEKSTMGGRTYGITKLACEKYILVYGSAGIEPTILRLHGVFSEARLGQFGQMIDCARKGRTVRVIKGAGGEYIHLEDVIGVLMLVMHNPKAYGEVFNVGGLQCYRDSEIASHIIAMLNSRSKLQLVEDDGQRMVSVSVDKLRRRLGYEHQRGDFLLELIHLKANDRSSQAA